MRQAQGPDIEASLHGLILMNGFHTTEKVNNSDVPQFVVPAAPGDNPAASTTSAAIRQTRLTLVGLVPEFAGGALRGELDVDFFGGQQASSGGRTFPLLRLRRAFAELTWPRAALLVDRRRHPSRGEPVFPGRHRISSSQGPANSGSGFRRYA